jgi:hypothetical protein
MRLNLSNLFSNSLIAKFLDNYYVENSRSTNGVNLCEKIKIAVEKNKKSQKTPYKTTTQNGASLLEAIDGRRQWCVVFWDSFGNRETPNLPEGP